MIYGIFSALLTCTQDHVEEEMHLQTACINQLKTSDLNFLTLDITSIFSSSIQFILS